MTDYKQHAFIAKKDLFTLLLMQGLKFHLGKENILQIHIFHFVEKSTFHSIMNLKCIGTIYGPGGAVIALGNLRHTVHW